MADTFQAKVFEWYGDAQAEVTFTVFYETAESPMDISITTSKFQTGGVTTSGGTPAERAAALINLESKMSDSYFYFDFYADGHDVFNWVGSVSVNSTYTIEGTAKVKKLAAKRKIQLVASGLDVMGMNHIEIPSTVLSAVNVFDEDGKLALGQIYTYDSEGNLTNCILSAYDNSGDICHARAKKMILPKEISFTEGWGFATSLCLASSFFLLLPIAVHLSVTLSGKVTESSPLVEESWDIDLSLMNKTETVELKSGSTKITSATFEILENESSIFAMSGRGIYCRVEADGQGSGELKVNEGSYVIIDSTEAWETEENGNDN